MKEISVNNLSKVIGGGGYVPDDIITSNGDGSTCDGDTQTWRTDGKFDATIGGNSDVFVANPSGRLNGQIVGPIAGITNNPLIKKPRKF